MKLLTLNSAILAAGQMLDDGENIRTYDTNGKEDSIYPKHVIDGWQIVDADVPESFTPAAYTWDGNAVVAKPPAPAEPDEYKFKRAAAYPPMSDYLDGIVKGDDEQVQAYIDACLAVKEKYPKPA